MPRANETEWLDQGRGSDADVAANLDEMWRLNRWLGGLSALTRHLYPRLLAASGPSRVLDLGTGSAHVPLDIGRWACARRLEVQLIGLDWAARHLAVARQQIGGAGPVRLLQADAQRLPLAEGSADFVISSLFLHHFGPEAAVEVLRAGYRAARRGLIMSDLVRGQWPALAFGLVQPVLARHPLTRHDGYLSICRAYTPGELRELAARAGLPNARVHSHWPWRMTLVVDRAA